MNAKAKQRTARTGIGRAVVVSEEPPPTQPAVARVPVLDVSLPDRLEWTTDGDGRRLDRALAEGCAGHPGLSRTRLQALIAGGHVTVDGRVTTSASGRVVARSRIVVDIPAALPAEPAPQAMPLTIVYEDAHLLVLDKPAGLVVHPAAGHADGTLVNALIAHCGDSLSGIGGVRRPGIVHRLDKDTSGLLVVAKTDAAHQGLAALFADHGRTGSLERCYTAFVWGHPATSHGTIDKALARHPHNREKMSLVAEGQGRHAVTHWRLEATLGTASRIRCELETGRTHQIRVHLTSIGHPVIGDPVYGTGFKTKVTQLAPAAAALVGRLGRQALHASVLGFEHPVTGEALHFESGLPPDLQALADALAEG
jgi:23S rRNA pseudouridine1911/1915/1917 synthase